MGGKEKEIKCCKDYRRFAWCLINFNDEPEVFFLVFICAAILRLYAFAEM